MHAAVQRLDTVASAINGNMQVSLLQIHPFGIHALESAVSVFRSGKFHQGL